MGKPKKNKKAEIKARRKSRRTQERITYLRKKEAVLKAHLMIMQEKKEAFEKLAQEEAKEKSTEAISSEVDQSTQSSSE